MWKSVWYLIWQIVLKSRAGKQLTIIPYISFTWLEVILQMGFLVGLLGFISGRSAHSVPVLVQGQGGGWERSGCPTVTHMQAKTSWRPHARNAKITQIATLVASQRLVTIK